jgi:hypothetical protein
LPLGLIKYCPRLNCNLPLLAGDSHELALLICTRELELAPLLGVAATTLLALLALLAATAGTTAIISTSESSPESGPPPLRTEDMHCNLQHPI